MPDLVRFDVFEVNIRSRELRRKGVAVSLQEQPFRILEILVAAAGRVVTREELAAALWPSGTFVEFDHGLNTAINKVRVALGDSAEEPRFIETVGRRGYRFIGARASATWRKFVLSGVAVLAIVIAAAAHFGKKVQTPTTIHSIAVLPLTNLSRNQDQEFFADGMTDQLITDLAKTPGLDVISHQSVMRFKSSRAPLKQIAHELGVDAVVEGTVTRDGSRMRVTAQLIDARTDRHLWASDYERNPGDVLSLQDEVARDIAAQIGSKLVKAPRAPPINSEAYLLYLRGRYEWNKLPPNFGPAMAFFEQSIKDDPNFALAYVGLADCYATRAGWQTPHLPNDAQTARSLAKRALQIDPSLSEAYTTLASLDRFTYDYAASESNFRRAIAANRNYIIAHQWYALLLIRLGRLDEAIREARIAVQLDPLSWYANATLATALEFGGRTLEAIERRQALMRLYPEDAQQHFKLFWLFHATGRDDKAVGEFSRGLKGVGFADLAAKIDKQYPTVGVAGVTRLYLADPVISREEDRWALARAHALLGDRERTLANLEQSFSRDEGPIPYINVNREFDFVRDDPRFQAIIRKMKLTPAPRPTSENTPGAPTDRSDRPNREAASAR